MATRGSVLRMLPRYFAAATSITLALAACGDDGAKDASVDIDNGSCGDQLHFTGELVDWDTQTSFCGIKDATIEVAGGAMSTTAPNGRFDLCLPGGDKFTKLTVTFSAAASECATPMSTYTTPTIVYADHGVIKAGGFYSARSITMARLPTFFTSIQQTFDPTMGQVFVHESGTPAKLTLAGDHGAPQVANTSGWVAGDTGADVFFPNVAVGDIKIQIAGGGTGETTIPVIAGTITNVAVIAR